MELLPCPFCGSNELKEYSDSMNEYYKIESNFVSCKCGSRNYKSKWNTRHSTWISVKDRLPNKDETVLCFGKYHNIGFYDYDDEIWREEGEYVEITVTHWQPLPQSPKEIE